MEQILTRSVYENFYVGIVILALEILIISVIITSYTSRREKKLWAPFKSILYRSVYDFHESLLKIHVDWRDNVKALLKVIQNEQKLTKENFEKILNLYETTLCKIDETRGLFFNFIQTASPALSPESASIIEEPMYFYERFNQHISRRLNKLKAIDIDNINDKTFSGELLKSIHSDTLFLGILINGRFNRYPHILKERAKKEDQLFYYEGEFVTSDFYNYITKGDNQIIQYSLESSKIERNISIVNFFDKENVI